MGKSRVQLCCLALLCLVYPGLFWAKEHPKDQDKDKVDLSNLVVVGDSLAAGFQNFSLLDKLQTNSFAYLIAKQAGVNLSAPLIPCPGIAPDLELISLAPPFSLPIIAPISTALPPPPFRDNPTVRATNLAVPGQTVGDALNKLPAPISQATGAVDLLTDVILGIPAGPARSQAQWAIALDPTTILAWIGNNDALLPALTGDFALLTPIFSFASSYTQLMQTLAQKHTTLVTANIPDITSVPFFTPVAELAQEAGLPAGMLAAILGVGPGDFLRPCALPFAFQTLAQLQAHQPPSPLPAICPNGIPGLVNGPIPSVLTAQQATTLRSYIDAYNAVIAVDSDIFDTTLVDMHSFVQQLHDNGYNLNGHTLTTGFLGGLFSLDGVHPTSTGHAILANEFIDVMNSDLDLDIPHVSVAGVAATDPLISPLTAVGFNACHP